MHSDDPRVALYGRIYAHLRDSSNVVHCILKGILARQRRLGMAIIPPPSKQSTAPRSYAARPRK